MLYYREDRSGQILEEGITEAGALSSWTAAATSYSTHGLPMLPFYIYYSMFGFQRVGDLIWAAADQRARGFLIGATAGRTTLGGEGLQHQDGTSHLVAATVPNCKAYDPATAGELAVIVDRGMREMLVEQKDVFYYVTAMNENLAQPSLPAEAHEGVLRGMYRFRASACDGSRRVQLLAAGAMLGEAIKAATRLEAEHGVAADLWSVTSFSELARAGVAAETAWRHGATSVVRSHVGEQLAPTRGPIVIATDYVRAVPEQIRAFLPPGRRCVTLGTDGFGRSDTRAALRATSRSTPRRSSRRRCAPGRSAARPLELEREPEQQALGQVAHQPRLLRLEPGREGALVLDPGGEAAHVGRLVERDHQLVVEEQAAQVEVGRAGQGELVVDHHRLGVLHEAARTRSGRRRRPGRAAAGAGRRRPGDGSSAAAGRCRSATPRRAASVSAISRLASGMK